MGDIKLNRMEDGAVSSGEADVFLETKEVVNDDGLGPKWMIWKRRRYLVIVMAFFGQVTKEALRTNLSVAVFPMTENHTVTNESGDTIYVQDFDWDVKTRGFLLSVFYYGFISTHILGGVLAMRFGGTRMYGFGVAAAAVSTLLTPTAAYVHFYLLVALRILEGMCEGMLSPSLELIFARWIPLQERNSLVAFLITGLTWGSIFGMSVSGAIAGSWGWPAIFYFTGGLGLCWVLIWFLLVKEFPALENNMASSELMYIQHSQEMNQRKQIKVSSIPFAKILTSLPVIGLFFGTLPGGVAYVLFTTQLPAYIKDVLELDTQNAGYLSSLPFIANVLTMYSFSPFIDWLISKNVLSITAVRKISMCGGLTILAATSFLIRLATTMASVVACLVTMHIFFGVVSVQLWTNMLDLAPGYSSVLSGIIYTGLWICTMFVPAGVGYLTQNKTAEEWHTVFAILAGIFLLGATMYGLAGSGELQPWAVEKKEPGRKHETCQDESS